MKRYKNVSPHRQFDLDPGQTGELSLSETQEKRMLERGALEVVGGETQSKAEPRGVETPGK